MYYKLKRVSFPRGAIPFNAVFLHKTKTRTVLCSVVMQTEADGQGAVDSGHSGWVKFSHAFFKTFFVDGSDLFEKNDAVLLETAFVGVKLDVCGQLGFFPLACDGSGDDCGTVLVSHVVLNDQHGTYPALLRAYDGAQICVIDFSPFYRHFHTLLFYRVAADLSDDRFMVLLLTVFVKIITVHNFSYSANILGHFIICRRGCTGLGEAVRL